MAHKKIKWQMWLLTSILALAGCGGPAAAPAEVAQPVAQAEQPQSLPVDLDIAAVEQLRLRDDVVVIDVREDFEFQEDHIPQAVLMPLGTIPNRLDDIPRDKLVIAVCRSGNRSNQATQFLRQQGFDNVHNMTGGMNAWSQAGYEVN
jgi:rhodanese-related sulfurtransferase